MKKLIKIVFLLLLACFMVLLGFYLRSQIYPTISEWSGGESSYILAHIIAYIVFFITLIIFGMRVNKWFYEPAPLKYPVSTPMKYTIADLRKYSDSTSINDVKTDFQISGITYGLLLFAIFFVDYPTLVISYFNQYALTSPIISVKTQITSKSIHSRRFGRYDLYSVYFNIFNRTQSIRGFDFHTHLEVDDNINVQIRKGRLGKYFTLELYVEKNNSCHYNLVRRSYKNMAGIF